MSVEKVKAYFSTFGISDRIREFESSIASVELAAQALHCTSERIAKSLSFKLKNQNGGILIVAAGDAKIDNAKFKGRFGKKAVMLSHDEVEAMTGHAVGGVCPFAINEGIEVFLDISRKRFDTDSVPNNLDSFALFLICGIHK